MIIYTDGSAHPNPGPGGFGVIVLDNDEKIQYIYNKQFEKEKVTNNQMELKAILYAFLNYGININTNEFKEFNIDVFYGCNNIIEALQKTKEIQNNKKLRILICGSLYFCGDVLSLIESY